MNKKTIITALLTFVALAGQGQQNGQSGGYSNDPLIEKLAIIAEIVRDHYVDSIPTDTIVARAVRGILGGLDPYSHYDDAPKSKVKQEFMAGSTEGVGINIIVMDATPVVAGVIPDSPAEKAGLRMGDQILSIDGKNVSGDVQKAYDAAGLLVGTTGSKVKLTIQRGTGTKPISIAIERGRIPLNSITTAYMLTDTIGYIRFDNFTHTTHNDVVATLKDMKTKGMRALILDLSMNFGGLSESVRQLAGEFLNEGDTIESVRGRGGCLTGTHVVEGKGIFRQGRMAVLVSGFTHSAAELLAAALQDHNRATVIGWQTGGKGTVTSVFGLPDGSTLTLATARYYTPSGRCIQKPYGAYANTNSHDWGIIPDEQVYPNLNVHTQYYYDINGTDLFLLNHLHYWPGLARDTRKRFIHSSTHWRKDIDNFITHYEVPDSQLNALIDEAHRQGITPADDAELKRSIPMLRLVLKSLVAFSLWGEPARFYVENTADEMQQRAVEVLAQPLMQKKKEVPSNNFNYPDVGQKFRDFSVVNDGKTTRLSDYVGRGQYVLVDFWASWCAPCRHEIPVLITAYEKYKDNGLIVLGVAVNEKPQYSLLFAKQMKIPYPLMLNAQHKSIEDAYGFTGIPHTILFAPDGTILARGLRGKDIDKKLEEIFNGQGQVHYRLEGTIGDSTLNAKMLLVNKYTVGWPDSVEIKGGKIVPKEGMIDKAEMFLLVKEPDNDSPQMNSQLFILGNGTTILDESIKQRKTRMKSGPLASEYHRVEFFAWTIYDKYDKHEITKTEYCHLVDSLIRCELLNHGNDVIGIWLLEFFLPGPDAQTSLSWIDLLGEQGKEWEIVKQWKESILNPEEGELSPSVGEPFVDFAVEHIGKTTRLSDYVGRGQYVLADFWASWCGPCREEIPNIIEAYNKYKDSGLQVIGIAASDKPEATLKAIKDLGIPYPQIINTQEIATDAYNIQGIPHIILFAPDGTILARGLRGKDIDKKLKEIFNDNK